MARLIDVKVFGAKGVGLSVAAKRKFLKSVSIPSALKKIGLFMQNEVKLSIAGRKAEPTSVDTGRFLNSVEFQVDERKDEVIIFSDVEYSKNLEFGTTRLAPRKHFNNSKDRNIPEITKILNDKVKTI